MSNDEQRIYDLIDGKAKRFKGKTAKFTIEKINGDWSFEINKIEIL